MRYHRTLAFRKTYKALTPKEQKRADETLLKLAEAFETGTIPKGLGIKPLQHGIWEARAGIHLRILFHRDQKDLVVLFLIGTHDQIKKFLKHL